MSSPTTILQLLGNLILLSILIFLGWNRKAWAKTYGPRVHIRIIFLVVGLVILNIILSGNNRSAATRSLEFDEKTAEMHARLIDLNKEYEAAIEEILQRHNELQERFRPFETGSTDSSSRIKRLHQDYNQILSSSRALMDKTHELLILAEQSFEMCTRKAEDAGAREKPISVPRECDIFQERFDNAAKLITEGMNQLDVQLPLLDKRLQNLTSQARVN